MKPRARSALECGAQHRFGWVREDPKRRCAPHSKALRALDFIAPTKDTKDRTRMLCVLRGCFLLALVVSTVAAQEEGPPAVRLASELVLVPVLARSAKGDPVEDMRRTDFALSEDGAAQEISLFERDTSPVDVVLLVDVSDSVLSSIEVIERAA